MNKNNAWLGEYYRFNATRNLWHRGKEQQFPIANGDEADDRIARILRESFDRSSLSLELQKADGATSEDFSPRRANLLRPLRHLMQGDVLEIGAGSGSLTRYLGETGANIVAVEKRERRAAAAAIRCADLPNVSVVADDFASLPEGRQFDVVTLIDVPGSARLFVGAANPDPVAALLARARSFLRPGGIFIIAVGNELGPKYLTHSTEDSAANLGSSLEPLPPADGLATFGRAELSLRLAQNDLPNQQWWFPLPDRALPVSLISDRALQHDVDLSALFAAAMRADPQGRRPVTLSQGRDWKPLFRNGLWPDLTDSFLVVSSDEELPDHNVLAVHYGEPRSPAFAKQLRFVWGDGAVRVERRPLAPNAAVASTASIAMRSEDEPFETGASWHTALAALTSRQGWTLDAWTGWARRWFDAVLFAAGLPSSPLPDPDTAVPGSLIDAIPRNLIVDDGHDPRFFNQEWRMAEPIEIGFLTYRALFDSLDFLVECSEPAKGVSLSKLSLFQYFVRSLGWQLTADDIRRYARLEDRIQAEIGSDGERPLSSLHDPIPVDAGLRHLPMSPADRLRRELTDARSKAERLTEALKAQGQERQQALGKVEEIEREFLREQRTAREARREIAALAAAGDRLAFQLRRAYSKPWHPVGRGLQRIGLRAVLLLKPLLPKRNVRSFQKSLEKRKPSRFQLEWEMTRVNAPLLSSAAQSGAEDDRDIALIESSGLFDVNFYAGTAIAQSLGMSPVAHYVKHGEASGLAPSAAFDPVFYAGMYRDVTERRLSHYLLSGRNEGRLPLPSALGTDFPKGTIDPSRPTVLVLVHEATRTGAPILAWNIVRAIRRKYNVVTVLQRPGTLLSAFEQTANAVVKLPPGLQPSEAEYDPLVKALIRHYKPAYVIANSVETRGIVPAFERHGVPVVALVHEFSSYYRPVGHLHGVLQFASQIVFPAQVVADAALNDHGHILPRRYTILPQGASELPDGSKDGSPPVSDPRILKRPGLPEHADVNALPPRDGTMFVVGMGTITMRKGVDSFISAAADVARRRPDLKIQFAWAGEAFNFDQSYVDFVEAQVERSGLGDRFSFLGVFSDMAPLYDRTDVMVLSSRLDPLPNVSIDCALRGIPVLCFEKASGMADILLKHPDTKQLVVPYLNASALADRIIDLATNPELRETLSKAMREISGSTFDMQGYVDTIDELAQQSILAHRQAERDFQTIKASGAFNSSLYQTGAAQQLGEDEAIRQYLQASRNAVPRGEPHAGRFVRRPLEGFHPFAYVTENPAFNEDTGEDPLAHYLRSGAPNGPWRHRIITPQPGVVRPASSLKIAIHGHFHYPELLPEFIRRLSLSRTHYDLLITTTSDERKDELERSMAMLDVIGSVMVVPNKGRDVGPLFSAYPREQLFSYDLIGHFHGKRSPHAGDSLGEVWRTFLWEHLVGGEYPMMDEIAAAFEAAPRLGLVFAEDPYLWDWTDNRAIAEEMASKLGIKLRNHFDFPIGTMFWARPDALAPLFDLNLTWDDYPSEPLPIDGTLLHVLERILPFATEKAGFDYATTHIRSHRR